MQMTPASFSQLQAQGIDVAADAMTIFDNAGGQIEISGGDPLDESSAQQVQAVCTVYNAMQLPNTVPVAVSSSDYIDCSQWSTYISESAGTVVSTVIYNLGDQYTLLTDYPLLFPNISTSDLSQVAVSLQQYFEGCTAGTTCPPSSICPVGSFAYSNTCVLCYDDTNPESPLCSPYNTLTCSSGKCLTCTGSYAGSTGCYAAAGTCTGTSMLCRVGWGL